MTGKYLLDTCFIIGLQQHNRAALEMIQSRQILLNQCAYSVITRLELLTLDQKLHGLSQEGAL